MVLVKGTDETSQQIVHARRSYSAEDMVWDARFRPVIEHASDGVPKLWTRKIGRVELLKGQ